MRSSRRALLLASVAVSCSVTSVAHAQRVAQGFAVERFYPSAPGGGWFVMDDLAFGRRLGGAMSLTLGYAWNPLRVSSSDRSQTLSAVSDQAFAGFGFAATYDRFRVYLNFDAPLAVQGNSGVVGGYTFVAPNTDPARTPDTLSDVRAGFDVRLLGKAGDRVRVGIGTQLYIPSGTRANYGTDGTYRGVSRFLVAGNTGRFLYAAHAGVHFRPLDDSVTPGSPRGPELLFGFAGGARLSVGRDGDSAFVLGPEFYGASALRSFFGRDTTALEGLFAGRFESTVNDGNRLRVKLGLGGGINPYFGAPEGRVVLGFELVSERRP